MIQLSNEFLIWYNLINTEKELKKGKVDLLEIIKKSNLLHHSVAKLNGKKINIINAEKVFVETDQQVINIIIRNLLDNALKYSTDGVVDVNIINNLNNETGVEISNRNVNFKSEINDRINLLLFSDENAEMDSDKWVGLRLVGFLCRKLGHEIFFFFNDDVLTFKIIFNYE